MWARGRSRLRRSFRGADVVVALRVSALALSIDLLCVWSIAMKVVLSWVVVLGFHSWLIVGWRNDEKANLVLCNWMEGTRGKRLCTLLCLQFGISCHFFIFLYIDPRGCMDVLIMAQHEHQTKFWYRPRGNIVDRCGIDPQVETFGVLELLSFIFLSLHGLVAFKVGGSGQDSSTRAPIFWPDQLASTKYPIVCNSQVNQSSTWLTIVTTVSPILKQVLFILHSSIMHTNNGYLRTFEGLCF